MSRITKQTFLLNENRIKAKADTMKWISAIKEDIDAVGIKRADISDRKTCRHYVFDWIVGQEVKLKETGTVRSDEGGKEPFQRK